MSCVLFAALVVSCAETTRYRVLTFLFDGVPEPGLKAAAGMDGTGLSPEDGGDVALAGGGAQARIQHSHEPYRMNKCRSCHDPISGGLVRELDEGLCLICHADLTREYRYVHGPVAAGACAFCHHYHSSSHPNLLLDQPTTLCLRCHDKADLSAGEHHQDPDRACEACHAPHGGDNLYFVRRSER